MVLDWPQFIDGGKALTASSDACGAGMGGEWASERWRAKFTPEERRWHIGWKELLAVVTTVEKNAPAWRDQLVRFQCDNTQAISYLNRGGGRLEAGNTLIRRLLPTCVRYNIVVRTQHLKGELNVTSDLLSRFKLGPTTADYKYRFFDRFNDPPHEVDVACDPDGFNAQAGVRHTFHVRHSFLEQWREAAGKRLWVNPP
ncbi:MAG: hypothetical protein AAFW98_18245, partial [Pseudomonadota bacterium]